MITTTTEIYGITERAVIDCRNHGYDEVAQELDDAMHLGSSGLEILGAIRSVFIAHRETLVKMVGQEQAQNVVTYVNKAYGAE